MAKFCVNCGAGLADGARFCPNCGAAVSAQPAAIPVPPPAPAVSNVPAPDLVIGSPVTSTPPTGSVPPVNTAPPVASYAPPVNTVPPVVSYAPPARTGSGVKILFIVLGVFAFLGLLLAGSCFYVAYRVKQKATEFKAEMGGNAPRYTGSRDACSKLSETEVGQALGQKVTSVESRGSMSCIYHFGPGGQKQVPVEYTWQGGTMAMKLSHGAMTQISGMDTFTTVPGIGDEAYMAPMNSALLMRKGDVMVNIDMRVADLNAEAAKAMARKIAGRL
jgi:zinc ribbon protein